MLPRAAAAMIDELRAQLRFAREAGDAALARDVIAELRAFRQRVEREELLEDVLPRSR